MKSGVGMSAKFRLPYFALLVPLTVPLLVLTVVYSRVEQNKSQAILTLVKQEAKLEQLTQNFNATKYYLLRRLGQLQALLDRLEASADLLFEESELDQEAGLGTEQGLALGAYENTFAGAEFKATLSQMEQALSQRELRVDRLSSKLRQRKPLFGWQPGMEQNLFIRYNQELTRLKEHSNEINRYLALQLGRFQAHLLQLEAGSRLLFEELGVPQEFRPDFDQGPALGGPEDGDSGEFDFSGMLGGVAQTLHQQQLRLDYLSKSLHQKRHDQLFEPTASPVLKGKAWLSSKYGKRIDPFTGRSSNHKGIDFAGRPGTKVFAAAYGKVIYADKRKGYGLLVEIDHGNGYVSRYAHHQAIKVAFGQAVRRGQLIATMGSTGRSTGPHLHYEVLYQNKHIDPGVLIRQR